MVGGQALKVKDSHHEHLLVLGDTAEITAAAVVCGVCEEPCSGATFACDSGDQCWFYAHKSCILSPKAIENPFHPHTLQPSYRLFTCKACLERSEDDCYGCPDCSVWFDLECALRVPEIPPGLEGQEQIHHPDHLHPLWFHEKIDGGTVCRVCKNRSGSLGPGYGCPECRFYIHNTCSDLPKEIQHPSHPFHPLKRSTFTTFLCPLCLEDCSSFPYECDKCDFRIDAECAFFADLENIDSLEPILPNFHDHPLLLYALNGSGGPNCRACEESCTSEVYACMICNIFLHKSCALLPRQISHPSHPDHRMWRFQHGRFKCSNCLIDREGMPYSCDTCEFYLDFRCAFEFEGRELVHHEIHKHLLEVFEKDLDDDGVNELECTVCHDPCLGTTYGCRVCGFFLHKPCTDLPEEIRHPAHPFHPLKRACKSYLECHGCLEHCPDAVGYYCEQCDFYLEFVCAFVVPRSEYEIKQYILHDMHKHPLRLNEKEDRDDGVDCAACGSRCSGPTFECRVCGFVVHRSCTDLPGSILKPPFHRTDSLQLIKKISEFTCDVCLKDCDGLYYTCSGSSCSCSLKVDITCALTEHPLITCERHSHPLIFCKKIGNNKMLWCNECHHRCVSSVFHCPTCDFTLDLLCGPLPCSLKLEIHYEILTLMDHYVVDVRNGECYCDICEEIRDPWARVYYCSRCSYHAEIECVMPELVLALTGKSGDVELRGPGRWGYQGKVISTASTSEEMQYRYTDAELRNDLALAAEMEMKEIVQSLTEDERNQLENILDSSDELFDDLNGDINNANAPNDDWPYSDKAFSQLAQRIISFDNTMLRSCWEEHLKFVRVRNCMVPEKLIPIFNDLYRKHGDVSEGLPLSQGMKALLFLYLCRTVKSMSGTAVVDVTEDALKGWWSSLRAVHQAGLRVQFAVDVLKRVVLAHFGLQASKYVADFDRKIKLLSDSIKEENALREEITGEKEKRVDDVGSGKSSLIDYSMKEASLLKYKNAGDIVLGYHPS